MQIYANRNLGYSILCLSVKVAEINGEMSDSQEEEKDGSADTSEDAQADQECPLEAESVIQNGAAEEMEVEREAQVKYLVHFEFKVVNNLYSLPFQSLVKKNKKR